MLATQCLQQSKAKTMEVRFIGKRKPGVTAKDLILGVIAKYGTDFATGYVLEYTGEAISSLSMEERMTVCNMSIEAGARAGLIAPDETTFEYLRGREYAPQGEAFDRAVAAWKELTTDEGATYDTVVDFDVDSLIPQVTWGTSPGMGTDITSTVPVPSSLPTENERKAAEKAIEYMGLVPGTPITEIEIDYVFIGSCTNGRIEDLRAAAEIAKGYKVSEKVTAIVVPGSGRVKIQAEKEGLDKIFEEAGFEWRDAGCSMCLAMNPDVLKRDNAVLPLPTVTLKDVKAAADVRIWYLLQWLQQLLSKAASLMSASGRARLRLLFKLPEGLRFISFAMIDE